MEIRLRLALPRDVSSVPVARRMLKQSMDLLGVEPEIVADLQLALTEACTNVLDHSTGEDDYDVCAGIDDDRCVLEVIDRGHGFDGSALGHERAAAGDEDGRGIHLMRALVDRVAFESLPAKGTVVHLEKRLAWVDDSVARRWDSEQESRR